jgi:very-short-patch-repair endonuclease
VWKTLNASGRLVDRPVDVNGYPQIGIHRGIIHRRPILAVGVVVVHTEWGVRRIDLRPRLEAGGGFIRVCDNPKLKSTLSRRVRTGELVRIMPGVYCRSGVQPMDRVRAATMCIPGAVIADTTALAIALHSDRLPQIVEVCTPTRHVSQRGYRFIHRVIPPELQRQGVMVPALAAVDVADKDPSALDELVRRGWADTEQYQRLLDEFRNRPNNRVRRRRVQRTSSNPWSALEREYHDVFDSHHITGWVANQPLRINGRRPKPDMRFKDVKLICEIDGRAFHSGAKKINADDKRHNEFVAAGWTVLNLTYDMLSDPDEVVRVVTTTRARLRREQRRRR